MRIDGNTSLEELAEIAKATMKELTQGEEFIVKDLFRGFEWNRISKGDRTKLGSMFLNFAQNEGNKFIKATKKTPQNQQQYIRL
ncbi:single-stranded DNA-binding protein [Bacillus cereus]|uniref:Single-stranded DNA-binding protein n=1 Tax=Bacillus cereus TaxID=1396 RepID=A0ABD7R9I5_BACCE|nr:single-stranded DNA-binding protein [Bacillus cereus]TNB92588.1 single-stranded DNA-binding protein [Bacillus cereus]BCA37286.1 hypothetical protein BwiPL1_56680 [Bacillus wiedmannii]